MVIRKSRNGGSDSLKFEGGEDEGTGMVVDASGHASISVGMVWILRHLGSPAGCFLQDHKYGHRLFSLLSPSYFSFTLDRAMRTFVH